MKEQFFEYIDTLFADKYNMLYTMQPATIVSFNPIENEINARLDNIDLVLEDIPISILGDKNSYISTPTLHEGTKGLLIFSKHDLYTWLEDGVDFEAKTDFSKNNAFFLIGASWKNNRIENYNLNAIELKTNKAFEAFVTKHILLDSKDKVEIKSALATIMTSSKTWSASSDEAMSLTSQKTLSATATTQMTFNAPKVSITNSATGEELLSLVADSMQIIEDLAYQLTLAKDSADQSNLTNASAFSSLQGQIATIKDKVKGFQ